MAEKLDLILTTLNLLDIIDASSSTELIGILRNLAISTLSEKVDAAGFSIDELQNLDHVELNKKVAAIDILLADRKLTRNLGQVEYKRNIDFNLPADIDPSIIAYGFTTSIVLRERRKFILELIQRKSQQEKITTIGDLISNVQDQDLKQKLTDELAALKEQSLKHEVDTVLITDEEKGMEVVKKQLEISKTKLDLLEKKSQIWLNILARESIASIIGAFLLIIISCCLLVAMFLGLETTKIVESAFLLILGYFFGQAVTKK